jgi:hypothetical protein
MGDLLGSPGAASNYLFFCPDSVPDRPLRFVLRRLGLTEQEFDARVSLEVNELLRLCTAERRMDRFFPLASPF